MLKLYYFDRNIYLLSGGLAESQRNPIKLKRLRLVTVLKLKRNDLTARLDTGVRTYAITRVGPRVGCFWDPPNELVTGVSEYRVRPLDLRFPGVHVRPHFAPTCSPRLWDLSEQT